MVLSSFLNGALLAHIGSRCVVVRVDMNKLAAKTLRFYAYAKHRVLNKYAIQRIARNE